MFLRQYGVYYVVVFFVKNINELNVNNGLFYGGGLYLLGVQLLEILSISLWTIIMSYLFLN